MRSTPVTRPETRVRSPGSFGRCGSSKGASSSTTPRATVGRGRGGGTLPAVPDAGDSFPISRIPLTELPDDVAASVADAGAKQVNLYRALAHAPDLLRAWIAFAWELRGHDRTSRR